jgi:hypothetical protein
MNPNPIKMTLDKGQLASLTTLIESEICDFDDKYYKMKGQDFLTYKILKELANRFKNKIQRHHPESKTYNISLDKGESWVLLFHFNKVISEVHPVRQLLGHFHQQLV